MDFVTKLSTAIVIDRMGLQSLKSGDEMASALATIYSHGLPVKIVDSAAQFFGSKNLAKVLEDSTKRDDLMLILEKRGVEFTEQDSAIVTSYQELKKRLFAATANPQGIYPFAKVPEGWSVENKISIEKRAISRVGGDYSIGPTALKTIWGTASKVWAGMSDARSISDVRASGYSRRATVSKNEVQIGCQSILRYELEQLALHLGWEFPTGD